MMNGDIALAPGERVVWSDHPRGWRAFLRTTDLFLGGFVLFAGLFFFIAILSAPRSNGFSALFGAAFPVIFFGLFFFGPRFVSARREIAGARFTLTDRRIVLHSRRRDVEFDLAGLQHLELERSWLSGSVIFFGSRGMYEGWGGFYGGSPTPAIRGIPDADRVYRMISDARAEAVRR